MNDANGAAKDRWTQIGWVDGNATSSEMQHYSYRHATLEAGVYSFRLKQLDFTGSHAYSERVDVTIGVAGSHVLGRAYPNPFREQSSFSLTMEKDQDVQITVFDIVGRRVRTLHRGRLVSGSMHRFELDGRDLTSGIYIVQVTGESFSDNLRVVLRD
jgi:hypothetical protein